VDVETMPPIPAAPIKSVFAKKVPATKRAQQRLVENLASEQHHLMLTNLPQTAASPAPIST
jgi:hypothetical protein